MSTVAARDPVAGIWELHFREPAEGATRAQRVLQQPGGDERTLAWAELTQGFDLAVSPDPHAARPWLDRAQCRFERLGDAPGKLLAAVGRAHLMIASHGPAEARSTLLPLLPEARRVLPVQDRYWLLHALGTTYVCTGDLGQAIPHLQEALDMLRNVPPSPRQPAVMAELAGALVAIGDFIPARELAEEAIALLAKDPASPVLLDASSCLAQVQLAAGEPAAALATVEAMFGGPGSARPAAQNHYCAVAAEVYALHGRLDDAERCVRLAQAILAPDPGGCNGVNARWAAAVVAAARDPGEGPLGLALAVAEAASAGDHHLPIACKAHALAASRYAALGRFEDAHRHQLDLFAAHQRRHALRASVRFDQLTIRRELEQARTERDRAERQRQETEALNRRLALVNDELSRRMAEVEELQSRLAAEAVRDPLTHLFNRRHLDAVMPGLLAAAHRRRAPLALALVDLDYFKKVNDRHGHLAGDKMLHHIGLLFAASMRPSDVLCRYGGEEFCIVMPDTDADGARVAIDHLQKRLAELAVPWASAFLPAQTFSAGIAVAGEEGGSFDELLSSADRALYSAKGSGRGRVTMARDVPRGA